MIGWIKQRLQRMISVLSGLRVAREKVTIYPEDFGAVPDSLTLTETEMK